MRSALMLPMMTLTLLAGSTAFGAAMEVPAKDVILLTIVGIREHEVHTDVHGRER